MVDQLLHELLARSATAHEHLCPRQVLGARMGLWAGEVLDLDVPRTDKRLLVIAESYGCALDGIAAATGCSVGRRTLRVEDYGKVAATFVDGETGLTVRITPHQGVRETAAAWAPNAGSRWHGQLLGYQRMPAELLLSAQRVQLNTAFQTIVNSRSSRVICAVCGEEMTDSREVLLDGVSLCRSCAGGGYYAEPLAAVLSLRDWPDCCLAGASAHTEQPSDTSWILRDDLWAGNR